MEHPVVIKKRSKLDSVLILILLCTFRVSSCFVYCQAYFKSETAAISMESNLLGLSVMEKPSHSFSAFVSKDYWWFASELCFCQNSVMRMKCV